MYRLPAHRLRYALSAVALGLLGALAAPGCSSETPFSEGEELGVDEGALACGSGSWIGVGNSGGATFDGIFALPNGDAMMKTGGTGTKVLNASTNTWSVGPSMVYSRYRERFVTLPNGHLFAIGGLTGNGTGTEISTCESFDPSTYTWTARASVTAPRKSFSAALMGNGKVITVGGYTTASGWSPQTTVEIYDPVSDSWSAGASMGTGRIVPFVAPLPSGKVLVVGGLDVNSLTMTSAEIYDPATNSWSPAASIPNASRTFVMLPNGRPASMDGGASVASGYAYDEVSDTWSGLPPMPAARSRHVPVQLASGKIAILGGTSANSYFIYDHTAGTWSVGPPMPWRIVITSAAELVGGDILTVGGEVGYYGYTYSGQRLTCGIAGADGDVDGVVDSWDNCDAYSNLEQVDADVNGIGDACTCTATITSADMRQYFENREGLRLADGGLLVAGGQSKLTGTTFQYQSAAEVFEPASNGWTVVGSMTSPRVEFGLSRLPNGNAIAVGGQNAFVSGSFSITATTEIFSYLTSGWTAGPSMSTPRAFHAQAVLNDGRVLVAGGRTGSAGTQLSSVEIYNPSTNTWMFASSMAQTRFNHVATVLNDGRVLVSGGTSGEIYNPTLNSWTSTGASVQSRTGHDAFLLNDGRVLAVGGTATPQTAEIYDPTTNTWSAAASMSIPRTGARGAVFPNGTVAIAGGSNGGVYQNTIEVYDPVTNTWSLWGGTMTAARQSPVVLTQRDGRIFIGGGEKLTISYGILTSNTISSCIPDTDADGLPDSADNCPSVANANQTDGDGDGVGDACDNCAALSNANQADGDADGVGDLCDNCVGTPNPTQTDTDIDGIGDACEVCGPNATDTDGDGTADLCDNCPSVSNDQADLDADGLGDTCDNCPGTSNADQLDGGDGDGVGDACDNCNVVVNPGQIDTDTDGIGDACETTCLTYRRDLGGSCQDAMLLTGGPSTTTNYGAFGAMFTGVVSGKTAASLVRCDLTGIPAAAVVTSGKLRLVGQSTAQYVGVHEALASWVEGSVTAASYGASYDPVALGTLTFVGGSTYEANITSLVSGWLATPSSNDGLYLRQTLESSRFLTSEAPSDQGNKPEIQVCWTLPPG